MFDIHRVELDWGGRKLVLETGKIARQADGAVVATYGESKVLATVVAAKEPREGVDFLPLTVDYQEKFYAAGRIPGGYFKREGRPTEKETLVSRLIDRPVRPLFADGWRNETQVIVTTLSHDLENDPDVLAMIAASAALTLSGAPFMGPLGAARVGFVNNEYVLNPVLDEMGESQLDLVVAGTQDAVLMVESEAKELSEDVMLGAVMFGHRHFQPVIDAIIKLAEKAAKEPRELQVADNAALEKEMLALVEQDLRAAYAIADKMERHRAVDAAKAKVLAQFCPEGVENPPYGKQQVAGVFKEIEAKIVRWNILDTGQPHRRPRRQDGAPDRLRGRRTAARARLGAVHPRRDAGAGDRHARHRRGRAVDRRAAGNLQGNVPAALQFPAVLGRRDRPHGRAAPARDRPRQARLARHPSDPARASRVPLHAARGLGDHRVRTARPRWRRCAAPRLALMDAGVPLKRPTAGIAMGLILEGERYAVLSDILGDEDHLGDMDFKVAGTERGVTSLQMDIKIAGITEEIMRVALAQAKDGRIHILGEMAKALTQHAPSSASTRRASRCSTIPVDKIREVIGSGGKVIREIVEKTGAKIDISDDGTVKVASANGDAMKAAINWIKSIASEPEVGHIYEGTVVKVMDFGAFVNFFGAKDGLVHISQLAQRRVQKVTDVVKEGDKVKVKLLGFDERGKVRLSMKVVDQETGEDLEAKQKAEARSAATRGSSRRRISRGLSGRYRRGGRRAAPFSFRAGERRPRGELYARLRSRANCSARSAHEKERRPHPKALDLGRAALFEHERVPGQIAECFAHLDAAGLAVGFHARCGVHRIAPDIV